ncbi:hypothetical protein PTTG_30958, partial [Puccinia triticina 1-1 BBBD Race 1]
MRQQQPTATPLPNTNRAALTMRSTVLHVPTTGAVSAQPSSQEGVELPDQARRL